MEASEAGLYPVSRPTASKQWRGKYYRSNEIHKLCHY